MTGWAWALFAGVCAVSAEAVFRHYPYLPYVRLFWISLPLALAVNYSVYRLMIISDNLLSGVVLFSTTTAILRVLYTAMMGEAVAAATWIAFTMIVLARGVEIWGK